MDEKEIRRASAKEMLDLAVEVARRMIPSGPVQRRFEMELLRVSRPLIQHCCKVTLPGSFYSCGTFGQYCSEECWNKGKGK